MMIAWACNDWGALDRDALYDILALRERVFVVEQKCAYQECDGADRDALHLSGKRDGTLVAYARIFGPGIKHEGAAIGRVIVSAEARGGLGRTLMNEAMAQVRAHFGPVPIYVQAQAHLERFYASLGFVREGDTYDEDGIPHVDMTRPA